MIAAGWRTPGNLRLFALYVCGNSGRASTAGAEARHTWEGSRGQLLRTY